MISQAVTLARLADSLNRRVGLPPLILMTDELRLSDPVAAAARLPHGCAIIVRHRDSESRATLARQLAQVARRCGLWLLISDDARLAISLSADGLHLPERVAHTASYWKALRPRWLITAAAHSGRAAARAARAGADAALLAPVFPTRSHPERASLGVFRARAIAAACQLPVYALGGINVTTARRLSQSGFVGFAGIQSLSGGHSE